ncbi:MAG TPA: hypothetical protein VN381_03555 [Anaerovoracaceae bacterium]|nr:hypothetical protein [Anaerovoracaceae bacterium]
MIKKDYELPKGSILVKTETVIRSPSARRGVRLQKTYLTDIRGDQAGKQSTIQTGGNEKSHISIGVFSLSHGAGATTAAVDIAEAISEEGYRVAVVSYDGKKDLEYVRNSRVTYIIPENKEYKRDVLIETEMREYQFIIIDFGMPVELSPAGSVIHADSEDLQELIRCQYKICLSFSNSWNIGKASYFLNNPDVQNNESYILAMPDANLRKRGLERLNVSLCDRNSGQIIDKLLRKIYLK